MSGGPACACTGALEDRQANWRVIDYKCNHSAFNGYHETPSAYSSVTCSRCQRIWRTKAKYADSIQQGDHQRFTRTGRA